MGYYVSLRLTRVCIWKMEEEIRNERTISEIWNLELKEFYEDRSKRENMMKQMRKSPTLVSKRGKFEKSELRK